ncbi:MAG: GTPase domain-containing protein [Deltaproteobacteria bacterium]|nr:GTPase domain-containing protein [Deltaproteobacteria bacterium]
MALFNYATRELSAKIVYYGPGLSGKTTNIEMVHHLLRPEQKGRLISLPTETDRTLFFDFLPVELGQIKGFKVRFHLYTVPGQVFYNATRRLVLQGVDGVVFVADSQAEMAQSNLESLKNLTDNLSSYGKKLEELPFVMQYNKRDLKHISSVEEMNARLNFLNVPVFEGIAKDGVGVSDTLVAISRMVFSHLRKTLLMPGEAAAHEEIGELADARIEKTFRPQEAEPLEEISDIEEIQETAPEGEAKGSPVTEELGLEGIEFLPGVPPAVEEPEHPAPEPGERQAPFSDFEEVEIEIPERAPAPPATPSPRAGVSLEVEEGGLTFLKFENPYVTPEGHAVLPAVFMDGGGNIIRLRIRITMEEQG